MVLRKGTQLKSNETEEAWRLADTLLAALHLSAVGPAACWVLQPDGRCLTATSATSWSWLLASTRHQTS